MAAKRPIVCVTWLDAHGAARSTDVYAIGDVPHKSTPVRTYGVLLKHDTDGVSLASEEFPETEECRNYTFIPAGMVLSVEKLRHPSQRRLPNYTEKS